LIIPIATVLALALSLIPPDQQAATTKAPPVAVHDDKGLSVIFLPALPTTIVEHDQATRLVPFTGPRPPQGRLLEKNIPIDIAAPPTIVGFESVNLPAVDAQLLEAPSLVGLESTALLELPEQPLRSPRGFVPSAPTNLRMIP
jgi:hypothetical protein